MALCTLSSSSCSRWKNAAVPSSLPSPPSGVRHLEIRLAGNGK